MGARDTAVELLGEFNFSADTPVGAVADLYEVRLPASQRDLPIGTFIELHMIRRPVAGRRLRLGAIELIVAETRKGDVTRVAIDLEPVEGSWRRFDPWVIWLRTTLWLPVTRRVRSLLPDIPKPAWWRK